jgi:hypothetical protein
MLIECSLDLIRRERARVFARRPLAVTGRVSETSFAWLNKKCALDLDLNAPAAEVLALTLLPDERLRRPRRV